jgi:hypothetical protein
MGHQMILCLVWRKRERKEDDSFLVASHCSIFQSQEKRGKNKDILRLL